MPPHRKLGLGRRNGRTHSARGRITDELHLACRWVPVFDVNWEKETTGRSWPVCGPSGSAAATSRTRLHLGLLGDLQRIVDFDPEIPDSAFKFRVSEQELYGPEIPGPSVDQRRFGAPH